METKRNHGRKTNKTKHYFKYPRQLVEYLNNGNIMIQIVGKQVNKNSDNNDTFYSVMRTTLTYRLKTGG